MDKIKIDQHGSVGMLWIIGWIFSIGLFHLSFWRAILALLIWPYHIGVLVSTLVHH